MLLFSVFQLFRQAHGHVPFLFLCSQCVVSCICFTATPGATADKSPNGRPLSFQFPFFLSACNFTAKSLLWNVFTATPACYKKLKPNKKTEPRAPSPKKNKYQLTPPFFKQYLNKVLRLKHFEAKPPTKN